jgi:hypothetical protein
VRILWALMALHFRCISRTGRYVVLDRLSQDFDVRFIGLSSRLLNKNIVGKLDLFVLLRYLMFPVLHFSPHDTTHLASNPNGFELSQTNFGRMPPSIMRSSLHFSPGLTRNINFISKPHVWEWKGRCIDLLQLHVLYPSFLSPSFEFAALVWEYNDLDHTSLTCAFPPSGGPGRLFLRNMG